MAAEANSTSRCTRSAREFLTLREVVKVAGVVLPYKATASRRTETAAALTSPRVRQAVAAAR